jgi:hypothetical protein
MPTGWGCAGWAICDGGPLFRNCRCAARYQAVCESHQVYKTIDGQRDPPQRGDTSTASLAHLRLSAIFWCAYRAEPSLGIGIAGSLYRVFPSGTMGGTGPDSTLLLHAHTVRGTKREN